MEIIRTLDTAVAILENLRLKVGLGSASWRILCRAGLHLIRQREMAWKQHFDAEA